MGRTLNSYFLRELLTAFFVGLVLFTSILLFNRVLELVDLLVSKGVRLGELLRIIWAIVPSFMVLTVPMALLFAILIALGRMSADNEIMACKSAGISLYQMFTPILLFAGSVFLLHLGLNVYVKPRANQDFARLFSDLVYSKVNVALKEHVFLDDIPGVTLYLDKMDAKGEVLEGLMLADQENPAAPRMIFARRGKINVDREKQTLSLTLFDGGIYIHKKDPLAYQKLTFSEYEISLDSGLVGKGRSDIMPEEYLLSMTELSRAIRERRAHQGKYQPLLLEWHKRCSLPVACLVFAFIGAGLGAPPRRTSRAGGFALSLVIFLLYYILYAVGENFGRTGRLPAPLMAWMPDLVFGLLGLYLFQTAASEKLALPLRGLEKLRIFMEQGARQSPRKRRRTR